MTSKIRTYIIENPLVLEEINEYLNRQGEYDFCKGDNGDDDLCFFNNKKVFAITHTDGLVELGPEASPLIVKYIEKELNKNVLRKKN